MTPAAGIALMMNNYLHDVATALLLASAVALLAVLRNYERTGGGPEAGRYYLAMHRSMTRLARGSLAWIVLGGIPRTVWYGEFEWANAAGRGQVAALVVKHVLAFAFVGAGAALWVRLRDRARGIRAGLGQAVDDAAGEHVAPGAR